MHRRNRGICRMNATIYSYIRIKQQSLKTPSKMNEEKPNRVKSKDWL